MHYKSAWPVLEVMNQLPQVSRAVRCGRGKSLSAGSAEVLEEDSVHTTIISIGA